MVGIRLFLVACATATLSVSAVDAKSLNNKIIGGEVVYNMEEYKYQVCIQFIPATVFCGGSIISEKFVITAAHCTMDKPAAEMKVFAGSIYRCSGNSVNVARKYEHESVILNAPIESDYDVALLELASNLIFGPTIGKIALPSKNAVLPDNAMAVASGWGYTYPLIGPESIILKAINLHVLSREECRRNQGSAFNDRMICASAEKEHYEGVCSGDSGGPLVVNNVLYGITSFGSPGCFLREPTVFTSVPAVRDFISRIAHV